MMVVASDLVVKTLVLLQRWLEILLVMMLLVVSVLLDGSGGDHRSGSKEAGRT